MSGDKFEVRETEHGKALFATTPVEKDSILLSFENNFRETSRSDTLQLAEDRHQYSTDPDAAENFINHSCNPNCYIDFDNLTFRARRDIDAGEELTFNYLTAEWTLAQPFECGCGEDDCYGTIRGFKYLSKDQQSALKPFLSPYLRKQLAEPE